MMLKGKVPNSQEQNCKEGYKYLRISSRAVAEIPLISVGSVCLLSALSIPAAASELIASELIASELVASELVASELVASELVASEPITTDKRTEEQPLTRLQVLQSGARREQLRRLHQADPEPQPETLSTDSSSIPAVRSQFAAQDGVYLYGEQPATNQLATAYFIFESNEGRVEGAFYTPSSSFDCAQGYINSNGIQLTVTDSYTGDRHSYALNIDPVETQLVSSQIGDSQSVPLPLNIKGFYELPVSESDRTVLATCQSR